MIRGFRDAGMWVKAHPFKAVGFTYLFCILSGCAAAMADYWAVRIALPLLIVAFVVFMATFIRDVRKLRSMGLLLVFLCAANPMQAEPQSAEPPEPPELEAASTGGVVVGVVVIGGIIFAVYIYRFCQRHFEPPPPPPPAEEEGEPEGAGIAPGAGSAAAATFQSLGSCYELRPASVVVPTRTVIELEGRIEPGANGPQFRLGPLRKVESPGDMDNAEFETAIGRHGLTMDTHYTGVPHFGRNGRPAEAHEVPISFDFQTQTVVIGNGTATMQFERSADLKNWEPVLTMALPVNQPVKLLDSVYSDQMFYRVVSKHP